MPRTVSCKSCKTPSITDTDYGWVATCPRADCQAVGTVMIGQRFAHTRGGRCMPNDRCMACTDAVAQGDLAGLSG